MRGLVASQVRGSNGGLVGGVPCHLLLDDVLLVREPPKRKASRRTVELPPETMDALRWHQLQQEAERLAAGTRYEDHDLIFAGPVGRPVDHRNVKKRHFHPLLAAAGLPRVRLYDLRHTHCTLLLGAGVPVHVVSQRLGRASAKMTLDVYANYLPDQHEDAVARYRAYVGAASSGAG